MNTEEKKIIINQAIELIQKLTNQGLSNYKIAKETGITERTVGNYVNGETKPSYANAQILIKWYQEYDNINRNGDSKIKSTGERFVKVLEYKGDTIETIQEKASIPFTDIENLAKGVGPLNLDIVLKILNQYKDISLQWLLNGKGEMVIQDDDIANANNKEMSPEKINTNYRLLPIINLDIAGGSMNQEVDTSEYTMGFIPFLNAKDGDICCYISGNSMTPLYPPGSAVQLRKIELWREFLEFGNVYAIDLIDGRRLIKEIRKGEDPENLTLHSFNREYEDAPVPKHIIRNIWQVIQKLEKVTMW